MLLSVLNNDEILADLKVSSFSGSRSSLSLFFTTVLETEFKCKQQCHMKYIKCKASQQCPTGNNMHIQTSQLQMI